MTTPTWVISLANVTGRGGIAAGTQSSAMMLPDTGQLYTWGLNTHGQLGEDGNNNRDTSFAPKT